MAFEERKYLDTIEFCLTQKTINVKWIEEVLKNGVVISSNPHRGAYPLNEDGEPDDEVQTLIGSTLKDILGEAGSEAQKKVDDLTTQLKQRDVTIQQYADSVNDLNHQISLALEDRAQRIADTHSLNQELNIRQVTIDQLNQELNELKEQVQGLSTSLSDRDQEIRNLQKQLTESQERESDVKAGWEEAQDELATVRAELDKANKTAADLKESITALEETEKKDAGTQ